MQTSHGRRPALLGAALAISMLAPSAARAHPVFRAGDVAVVAIHTNPSGTVSFAFAAMTTFHPVETIRFTDRGWLAEGRFRNDASEGELSFDVERTIAAGTVIELPGTGAVALEAGADQVFAYVGPTTADGTPTDTLLFGLTLGGPWAADATSTGDSALPPSLAGLEVALGAHLDCAYAGPTVGTRSALLASIGDPARWTCSDAVRPAPPAAFTVYADRGEACGVDADCGPGVFCAYGVCCESACRRDEAGHCATCNYGPGDPRNGTCGPAPTSYLCRTGRGPCDPMDHCDGVSVECPPNEVLDTICRPSTGGCDPAERCDGVQPSCPADARAEVGSVCRPSRGVCDPEERCAGEVDCPVDVVAPEGTECDDGLECTASSSCAAGVCAGAIPRECDDGDRCTADACRDEGGCLSTPVAGCCHEDADCDDGDPCSVDTCGADGWCVAPTSARCPDAGSTDGGVVDGPPAGGCGCATAVGGPPSGAAALAWLALLLWRRRAARY